MCNWQIKKRTSIRFTGEPTQKPTKMSDESATCGGAVAGSIIGTIICIALLAFGAWWLYRRYWRSKSGESLLYSSRPVFMANIGLRFASRFFFSKMSNEDRLYYYVCITYLHIEQLASLWLCRLQYDQKFGTGEKRRKHRNSWESSTVNASIIQYQVFWAKFRANVKRIMISLN